MRLQSEFVSVSRIGRKDRVQSGIASITLNAQSHKNASCKSTTMALLQSKLGLLLWQTHDSAMECSEFLSLQWLGVIIRIHLVSWTVPG